MANDGQNPYPDGDTWLTDGYGDFVRHYVRAMAALPYLSPSDEDHLLRSTSVVKSITYGSGTISYETFDNEATEKFRVTTFTPATVTANAVPLTRYYNVSDLDTYEGWTYNADGGLNTELRVHHTSSGVIEVG